MRLPVVLIKEYTCLLSIQWHDIALPKHDDVMLRTLGRRSQLPRCGTCTSCTPKKSSPRSAGFLCVLSVASDGPESAVHLDWPVIVASSYLAPILPLSRV